MADDLSDDLQDMDEWEMMKPLMERVLHFTSEYIQHGAMVIRRESFFSIEEAMDIYTECYNLSIRKDIDRLESIYRMEMDMIQEFITGFEFQEIEGFLRQINGFTLMMKWFDLMFHHVNRAYLRITDMASPRILPNWFIDPRANIIHGVLQRRWSDVRESMIHDDALIDVMTWIDEVYPEFYMSIHSIYIDDTRSYYQRKRTVSWSEGCSFFIRHIMAFREQDKKMDVYIQEKTRTAVRSIFVEELFSPHFVDILYDERHGWEAAMDHYNDEMPILILFLREGYRDLWGKCHMEYVQKKLANIERIDDLLVFFGRQEEILQQIPDSHDFSRIIHKEIHDYFLHHPQMDHPLMRSFDILMRKRNYGEMSMHLELIRLFPDQEHMHTIYRRYLAGRLIDMETIEEEKRVIPFLKKNKNSIAHLMDIITMLTDVRDNVYHDGCVRIQMVSKILWGESSSVVFPPEIMSVVDRLHAKILREKDKQYRLELSSNGSVFLIGRYADGRQYEFIMTPEQATIILYLQSSVSPRSSEEMMTSLRIPLAAELCHCLSSPRLPILCQNDQKEWQINPSFHSQIRRHRVRSLPITTTATKSTPIMTSGGSSEAPDHDFRIDAMLVRLMKDQRTITHHDLIVSIGKILHYTDVRHIKHRIESLIDRDYIQRDMSDLHVYHYIP